MQLLRSCTAVALANLALTSAFAIPLQGGIVSSQKPLLASSSVSYFVQEQTEEICRAGSKQYTGRVQVTDEKNLFFWFFESRADPFNSPTILWLNGGPGGSSMMGLFKEIGPCLESPDGNDTIYNPDSWSNYANLLFIDQPAGVGLSSFKNGTEGGPDNALEAAADMETLLSAIFTKILPQYSHLPFHIAGESFGGHYVPATVDYIFRRQQMYARDAFPLPIASIILVDAVIDHITSGPIGQYEHFCAVDSDGNRLPRTIPFNDTACEAMEAALPECEKLTLQCLQTYDVNNCRLAMELCSSTVGVWHDDGVVRGGRDPYDDRLFCEEPPLCEGFNTSAYVSYLNLPRIKKALGIDEDFNFTSINFDLNERWEQSGEVFLPTTREVSFILDHTPTKLLVLNGNNDAIVNTEGQRRVYDHLPWSHQASYRIKPWSDWVWPESEGVYIKKGQIKSADKLSFADIDEAGHASPGDQKAAVSWLVNCWVNGEIDTRCPF